MGTEEKSTVYIIDDDEQVRTSLCFLINSWGLSCESYPNADEFLACYDNDAQPGCVLVDHHMPGMSGIELLAELGRRGTHLPVIILTGSGDVEIAVHAMKLGAFDFLEKPVCDSRLLETITEAIERDHRQRGK